MSVDGTVTCGECGSVNIIPANLREAQEENARLREQLTRFTAETSIQASHRALSRMPFLSGIEWAALPEQVRQYVEQIETIADPAGLALENAQLRDQLAAMAAKLQELWPYERTLKDVADHARSEEGAASRALLVFVNDRFRHWSPK